MGKHELQWHHIECGEVLNMLRSNPVNGLSAKDIPGRQDDYGKNVLSKKKGENLFILFLNQFNQALVYILLAAALGVRGVVRPLVLALAAISSMRAG